MYTVNQQIKDTFKAFKEDPGFTSISGLTFSKSLWIDSVSSNASAVTVSEDSSTGGVYYLTYIPSATGTHYINLFNSSAIFDASYYVTSGFNEVWTNSGTSVINSITLTGLTASVNYLLVAQNVWGYSISGSAVTAGSMGEALSATWQVQTGRWEMTGNQLKIFDKNGSTILRTFDLFDSTNTPSLTGVVKRVPV